MNDSLGLGGQPARHTPFAHKLVFATEERHAA